MILHKNNTFYLQGKTYSYVMRVNEWGYLEHLHFGAPVGEDDLGYLAAARELSFAPVPPDAKIFSLDTSPQEYAGYGQGDFRTPSAMYTRSDGGIASRFRYAGYALGGELPQGLPAARGGELLTIYLEDACAKVRIALFYAVFDAVLVRWAKIEAGERISIKRAYSFSVDLPAGDYGTLVLHGRHAAERTPEKRPLGHGALSVGSRRGASSHQMNPFLALYAQGAGEETGEVYGFELLYSGSFTLVAERSQTETVRIAGGVDDTNFSWQLGVGEAFYTPQVALCYTNSGFGGMSRALADFLRSSVIAEKYLHMPRPIVANNWEATYFDFDRGKLLALIDAAAPLGVDTFVLDDGWFGKRDSDTTGLGDWYVNLKKLEGGLAPLVARCKAHGMRFGIWFEPEMVSEDSDLYRAHPDYAIGRAPRCTGRNQYILDFSRPEVVECVYAQVAAILRAHEISYVKWDMNRHMTEFFSEGLPAARQGELQHRYMLGVYALARRLTEDFPEVFFEGCSGGGGRFDAGMLAYFPQIWTSDNTDSLSRAGIQWGTSYAYPVSAMSCHVSACPNHQTGRVTPFSSRGHIASLGATGYELDLGKLTEKEREAVRAQIAAYRRVAALVQTGDLYRLLDPFTGNYFAEMLVAKDKKTAYVVGMTVHAVPADFPRRIRLAGLDGAKKYRVEELGLTCGGGTLMHAGLPLPSLGDCATWAWHLVAEA